MERLQINSILHTYKITLVYSNISTPKLPPTFTSRKKVLISRLFNLQISTL